MSLKWEITKTLGGNSVLTSTPNALYKIQIFNTVNGLFEWRIWKRHKAKKYGLEETLKEAKEACEKYWDEIPELVKTLNEKKEVTLDMNLWNKCFSEMGADVFAYLDYDTKEKMYIEWLQREMKDGK